MNAQGILRRAIREARYRTQRIGEPGRSGRAGILYGCRERGTLEGFLRLTVVIEAKLIDGCIADCPRVADVVLLESFVGGGSESGHVRARSLELCKGEDHVVIIKIIV